MPLRVLILATFASMFVFSGDAAMAAAKGNGKGAFVKRFDLDGNGKINNMERAAARMTIAQQREQRAMRRNDKMLR